MFGVRINSSTSALFLVFLTLSYILSFWILLKLETDGGRDQAIGKSSNKMTCGVWKKSCCAGGTTFFDALKAMVTRQLFLVHSMVAIYRVTYVLDESYWYLAFTLLGLITETVVVLIYRRGKEWNWFQPSVLLYLISVVPAIWLLEIDNLEFLRNGNNTVYNTEQVMPGVPVNLTRRDWLVALEQSLLVLIIIGRWLIPKGDLTRDQLSSLLITNLGTASDIADFYSILDESQTKQEDDTMDLIYVILVFWTWSLLQFPFVRTSKKSASEDIYDGDTEDDQCQNKDEEQYTVAKGKVKYFLTKIQYTIRVFLETEGWAIFVSLIMQDGPFFIIRIISIFYYNILTYTNYFFAAKNALILALQMYRIVNIYLDYKAEKQRELMEKRNLHNFKPKFMDYTDLVKYTRKK